MAEPVENAAVDADNAPAPAVVEADNAAAPAAVEADNAAAAEAAEAVEGYITQTQSSLGQLITKPRLLPDRLRKPPFRFLFDIATEVARTTGFGLAELFGGEVAEKPTPPGSKEDKIAFLERWIATAMAKLEGQPVSLDQVSPANIISGIYPEWTNYLLQCTAVAAWTCRPPVAEMTEEERAAAAERAEEEARAKAEAQAAAEAADSAAAKAREEAFARARVEAEAATAAAAAARAAAEAAKAQPAQDLLPPRQLPVYEALQFDEEEVKARAEGMDFSSAFQEFAALQDDFAKTATQWGIRPQSAQPAAEAGAEEAATAPGGQEADEGDDAEPRPPPAPTDEHPLSPDDARPKTAGQAPLKQAALATDKITTEIQKAQDILDEMELALERDDEVLRKQREGEAKFRALKDAEKQKELDKITAQQEAEAEKLREQEEETREKKERKEAEKARRRAAKAEAEAEAARLAAEAAFPRSKLSQTHGARIVSCVGDGEVEDDEYEWDGDPPEAEAAGDAASTEEATEATMESALDPMAGCFTDAILGPSAPEPSPGVLLNGEAAVFCQGALVPTSHPRLFDQLKGELGDTFVSFLSASMPSSLLKKYNADELIGCLQFLLRELRKCLSGNNLGDVHDEEPTSLAEDLKQNFPNDWLAHLLGASPWALRQKYDLPELIDTLQGLMQVCEERLSDELGPLVMWCSEDSPLRSRVEVISPAPLEQPEPIQEEEEEALPEEEPTRPLSAVAPTPYHQPIAFAAPTSPEPARLGTSAGLAASRAPPPPPPAFSADLGPALWEQEELGLPKTAGPARAPTGRIATGTARRTPAPPLTASRGAGFSSTMR
mmetsp:Transcript_87974/g.226820  ORF Transcript_87974/g.226820 Transcript_87974/m.226820 type:complete len:838 (-) Transcript_87974:35-2548(-)|eukprot:CAMPEP_0195085592 /NCGR_PEP_ID=MMETSP0448-20130528/25963_1 /TAXON_ID=66468 /ORGANISM="Heterocapsa triquestra, Strain CCMP 448" /LENGTH=837 /DNA_ID=CAMNT_0040118995 /DNA_START=37 /DNA_END=2550 /DNA_ORIENTATION=+